MKKMEDEKLEQAAGGGDACEVEWTPTYLRALASECPYFSEKPDKLGNCMCECGSCKYCVHGIRPTDNCYGVWCQKGQVL